MGIPVLLGRRFSLFVGAFISGRGSAYLADGARFSYKNYLMWALLKVRGVTLILMDTEGFLYRDDIHRDLRYPLSAGDFFDVILAWNKPQLKYLKGRFSSSSVEIVEFGNPEFSFWTNVGLRDKVLRECRIYQKPEIDILWNTAFPRANLRFADAVVVRNDSLTASIELNFQAFVGAIDHLATIFPELNHFIRPHPNEDDQVYAELESKHPNVTVGREGPSFMDLSRTRMLIHYNCTTAFEAFLLGLEDIISFNFFPSGSDLIALEEVSTSASGRDELVEMVKSSLVKGESHANIPSVEGCELSFNLFNLGENGLENQADLLATKLVNCKSKLGWLANVIIKLLDLRRGTEEVKFDRPWVDEISRILNDQY